MARPTSMQAAQAQRQAKLRDALTLLESGITSLLDSASLARYPRERACFHQYSAHNILLIPAQRPEAARVAGYRTWRALGQQVRKGEKDLVILVPLPTRLPASAPSETAQNAQSAFRQRMVPVMGPTGGRMRCRVYARRSSAAP